MTSVRDRRTEGVTRARLGLEARRSLRPLAVTLGMLLLAVPFAAFFAIRTSATFGHSTTEVRFLIADDFGVLAGHDEVRYRGVSAGTIETIRRQGTELLLTARIRTSFGPIYQDAKAEMRSITPLNDVYLDITDPGTPSAGRASASRPLPEAQTATLVTVPDVLDSLRANQRAAIHTTLDQLGNGMRDRGSSLRRAFVQLAPVLQGAGQLTHELAVRQQITRRLVHNAAVLTTVLGERDGTLRTLVEQGSAVVGTLQQGTPQLDATLAELPPTLTRLDGALSAVDGAVGDVDGGVDALMPVAGELGGDLLSLRRLSASLNPAVRALQKPVARLVPLARAARPAAQALNGAAVGLLPQTDTADATVATLSNCTKPIQDFFQFNASLSKFGDSHGPVPRGNLVIGVADSGVGKPARQPLTPTCVKGHTIGGRPATAADEG